MRMNTLLAVAGMSLLSIVPVWTGCADDTPPPMPVPPPIAPPTEAPGAPEPPKHAKAPDAKLIEKDNGKTVTTQVGDMVEVRLESNATTGFEWSIAQNDPALLKPLGEPKFIPPNTEVLGQPGAQVFQFTAQKIGTDKLELHYARSWEKGKPPAQTFEVSVEIKLKSK